MSIKKDVFVFDAETIADVSVVKNLLGEECNSPNEAKKAMEEYHLKITKGRNDFLRQLFHQIVAISYVYAQINYDDEGNTYLQVKVIKSAGNEKSTEKDLVSGFFSMVDKYQPKLVSFNGLGFDIPVLKYRAMKHGITGMFFHNGGTKWENYKRDNNWHCDLIEVLSDYGKSARIKLNEACSIFGFPGKFGVDGSNVWDMYQEGKLLDISNYCETDAVNTYLVYLRYILHTGVITTKGYNKSIDDLLSWIDNSNKKHLLEFIEEWKKTSTNNLYL